MPQPRREGATRRVVRAGTQKLTVDGKTFLNSIAFLCGLSVAIGSFLPMIDVGIASRSFMNSIKYGEGAAVLVAGLLCTVMGFLNIFSRRDWELIYVFGGLLAGIEAGWTLHQLREMGVTNEFIGPAPYMVLIGGVALFFIGLIARIGYARPAGER